MNQNRYESHISSLDGDSQVLNREGDGCIFLPLFNLIVLLEFKIFDVAGVEGGEDFLELEDEIDGPVPKTFGDVQLDHGGLDEQILEEDRDRNGPNFVDLNQELGHGMQVEDDPDDGQ